VKPCLVEGGRRLDSSAFYPILQVNNQRQEQYEIETPCVYCVRSWNFNLLDDRSFHWRFDSEHGVEHQSHLKPRP